MLRLKKYLKPYLLMIVVSIGLLFASNICDLKLPDVMSDIVNVGIQQSGIEHASMDIISEDGLDFLTVFMEEDEAELVKDSYVLEDGYYHLNSNADRETLDEIFSVSEWTLINALQELQGTSGTESISESVDDVDLRELYTTKPLFEMMDLSNARSSALALDESMRSSTGVVFAKMFYEEAGEDTSAMQSQYILSSGIKMLGIAFIGICATIAVSFIASKEALCRTFCRRR